MTNGKATRITRNGLTHEVLLKDLQFHRRSQPLRDVEVRLIVCRLHSVEAVAFAMIIE